MIRRKRIIKKNKNKYIEYKSNRTSIITVISIFIVTIVLAVIYISYVKDLIYKNVYQNINEISEQTATQLNLAITDQKNVVGLMGESIKSTKVKTEKEIFDIFQDELEKYHFTRLVILDKNGNGYTSDGYEVKNYKYIQEFFEQSEVYLSENRPSTVADNQVNIYSKTFMMNGEKKVLMATINTSDYKEILLRRLFGKGGTYLINSNGTVLIDSFDNIKMKDSTTNLYEYFTTKYNIKEEREIKKLEDMKSGIKQGKEGTFDIELGKETHFVHYEKLNINDWYVVTTASDSTIANELIGIVMLTITLCLIIVCAIVCTSIYISVSNQKKNHKIFRIAYIDPVTLLGNEAYFKGNGAIYLEGKTSKNKYIITVDINKFKALNKIYGYIFCNEILKKLGQNLSSMLPMYNITCRVSNDIFASIFSYEEDIHDLLSKIYNEASNIEINGIKIKLNLAIGAYNIFPDEIDVNKILDKAYIARSQIKGVYNNSYYLFDEKLENKLMEEQMLETNMEEALKEKEFVIVYQPKTFTHNEKMSGAEALVRWNKGGKMIPPNKFIPLFEKNKFILKLDMYIFETVCQDIAEWKEKFGVTPSISINVSKEHFSDENFIDKYVEICKKYNIPTNKIDLEVTESATIDENIDILKVLNKIKEKGFIVSIDDFGTGYSSLSMLQNMPIDIIKVDKIFVDKADLSSNRNIINHIIFIAESLGIETIVEGVETKEQAEYVKKIQANEIQGYYYSKPISKEQFEEYFNKNM